jgi:hypothetical protein
VRHSRDSDREWESGRVMCILDPQCKSTTFTTFIETTSRLQMQGQHYLGCCSCRPTYTSICYLLRANLLHDHANLEQPHTYARTSPEGDLMTLLMTGVYKPVFEILKPMLVSNPNTELGQLRPIHNDHQLILA